MNKFFYYTFAAGSFISAAFYIFSSFTPVISPSACELMPFLALGFPYLALTIIILIITWFFIQKKYAAYLFVVLLAGSVNIYRTFAFNIFNSNNIEKSESTTRILSWNVAAFDRSEKWIDSPGSKRRQMLNYLQHSKADIICLQEMFEATGESYFSNGEALYDLGYHYQYGPNDFSRRYDHITFVSNGTAIYSKLPIIDTSSFILGDSSHPERLMIATINVNGKALRVASCHFKSINIFGRQAEPNYMSYFHGDSTFIFSASPIKKLVTFGIEHAQQARLAKSYMANSSIPTVFTTDMNSVPTSHAYATMIAGMQDAFIKKGLGLGGTLDSLPKTLRIDYLMADKQITIKGYQQDRISLSDHFPHFMDIQLHK